MLRVFQQLHLPNAAGLVWQILYWSWRTLGQRMIPHKTKFLPHIMMYKVATCATWWRGVILGTLRSYKIVMVHTYTGS